MKKLLSTAKAAASAVAFLAILAPAANAGVLLFDNVTGNPSPVTDIVDEFRPADSGILARIDVDGTPVTIDQFGVFGRMAADGNVNFAIFEADGTRLYASGLQATPGAAALQWYDSPLFSLVLAANTTYYMGVISDQGFVYHWWFPGTTMTQNGLTSLGGGLAGNNGNFVNAGDPTFSDACCFVQQGTRIFGNVPEPATMALLGLGLAGLGFSRRKLN